MKAIRELFAKFKPIILYGVFGVCTTLINWGVYYLCYNSLSMPNVISTILAWVVAVAFAFITNKKWVFDSQSYDGKTLIHEVWTFVAARGGTGVLDVAIMYFAVDVFKLNATIWKMVSNIIVIILNYLLSKLIVFKKGTRDNRTG